MKKTACFLISLFYVFTFIGEFSTVHAAPSALPISASSAILLDPLTKKAIFSKTPHRKRAPASTTKVLTSILAVENLKMNHVVTIPSFVNQIEPSKIYLRPGEKYYVRDLVRATLINSANDAAEVLAYAVAGSRSKFSAKMNRKVKQIGGRRSNFVRASGLPAKGQYSTTYDLALIMHYADRYPFIAKTLKTKRRTIRSLSGRKIYLKNHNKMLWRDSREVIGKTGWTRRAKHCFVGHIKVYGRSVYVAIMGSRSLWNDLKKLVDFQFGSSYRKVKTNSRLWSITQTERIQKGLKRAGYSPGTIDGMFGPKTVNAVERFQKAKGLGVDGIVGKQTWARIKAFA